MKKLQRQRKELVNMKKLQMLMGRMKVAGGGGYLGRCVLRLKPGPHNDVCSAKSGIIRGDGERPLSKRVPTFS